MAANKGLILLLAIGGAAALLLGGSDAKADTAGGSGPVGPDCELDSNMPPEIRAQVVEMLGKTSLSSKDLESASAVAQSNGYPKAAACLKQKAQQVKAAAEMEMEARGGMPFIIRYGDIPNELAKYYTGDPTRWRELGPPLNPQVGSPTTVNGVTNFPQWHGTILIPKSWNPLDKPLPAPLSGGGGYTPSPDAPPNPDVGELADIIKEYIDQYGTPPPIDPNYQG